MTPRYAPILARLIKGDDTAIQDELRAGYWIPKPFPNEVKEKTMDKKPEPRWKDVRAEATHWLKTITPGEWKGYCQNYGTGNHKQMLRDIKIAIEKGSPYHVSGVSVTTDQICMTGNGKAGWRNAQFIAAAPRLIQELLDKNGEYVRLIQSYQRLTVNVPLEASVEYVIVETEKIAELEDKVEDLEDHLGNRHWFVPSAKNLRTVGGVDYLIIDRELYSKERDKLEYRIKELESAQNIFPEMDTAHKLIVQDGVAYVMMRRDDYSEELKNAAIENTRRTIRQINKRHEAEVARLQNIIDSVETERDEYMDSHREHLKMIVSRDDLIAGLDAKIDDLTDQVLREDQSLAEMEARIEDAEKVQEDNDVLRADIEIWRKTLFEANERIRVGEEVRDPKSGEYIKAVQRYTKSEKIRFKLAGDYIRLKSRFEKSRQLNRRLFNVRRWHKGTIEELTEKLANADEQVVCLQEAHTEQENTIKRLESYG